MNILEYRKYAEVFPCPDGSSVWCFEAYNIKYCDPGDEYYPLLNYLNKTGVSRNAFKVENDCKIAWRIGSCSIEPELSSDNYVRFWSLSDETFLQMLNGAAPRIRDGLGAMTFTGTLFSVSSSTGDVEKIGWFKN